MDKVQTIQKEVEELLGKMIGEFTVDVHEENGMFQVIIKTQNEAPTVIGRHGETIRAVQKILEVILYKKFNEPVSLLVNVNDYREKQKERLDALASENAQKTIDSKEPQYIRGLSSFERRMVHEYITANYPDLVTYSVGDGRDRRLVVDLKGNEPEKQPEA